MPQPSAIESLQASAIVAEMAWWRHSRLAQAVKMVLLFGRQQIVANSSLCALENKDAPDRSGRARTSNLECCSGR